MDAHRAGGVYVISVAARLVEAHPRTLRIYEAKGLLRPVRRSNLRLYSRADIERLMLIRHLTVTMGVDLAGVRLLLRLYDGGRFTLAELLPDLAEILAVAGFPPAAIPFRDLDDDNPTTPPAARPGDTPQKA